MYLDMQPAIKETFEEEADAEIVEDSDEIADVEEKDVTVLSGEDKLDGDMQDVNLGESVPVPVPRPELDDEPARDGLGRAHALGNSEPDNVADMHTESVALLRPDPLPDAAFVAEMDGVPPADAVAAREGESTPVPVARPEPVRDSEGDAVNVGGAVGEGGIMHAPSVFAIVGGEHAGGAYRGTHPTHGAAETLSPHHRDVVSALTGAKGPPGVKAAYVARLLPPPPTVNASADPLLHVAIDERRHRHCAALHVPLMQRGMEWGRGGGGGIVAKADGETEDEPHAVTGGVAEKELVPHKEDDEVAQDDAEWVLQHEGESVREGVFVGARVEDPSLDTVGDNDVDPLRERVAVLHNESEPDLDVVAQRETEVVKLVVGVADARVDADSVTLAVGTVQLVRVAEPAGEEVKGEQGMGLMEERGQ